LNDIMPIETSQTITPELAAESDITYLGFSAAAYDNENPMYEDGHRPLDRIAKLNPTAREQMTRNVTEFDDAMSQADINVDIAIEMKKIIRDMRIRQAREFGIPNNATPGQINELEKKRFKSLKFLYNLGRNGGLFEHLDETRQSAVHFFNGLKDQLNSGKYGELLTPKQVELIEFVAATHDLPKLLGDLNAQTDCDHEIIYREILSKHLKGHFFMTSSGEKITIDEDDVIFVTEVVGMHEDIWREKTFAAQVDSLTTPLAEDPKARLEQQIKRGRMLFHIIDIFGAALQFNAEGQLVIQDMQAFQLRFVDLFRRHLNLPIKALSGNKKEEDWQRGKVLRPQWGLEGVSGLNGTFRALKDGWGIDVSPELIKDVAQQILNVLTEAEVAAQDALDGGTRFALIDGSRRAELEDKLNQIHQVKNEMLG